MSFAATATAANVVHVAGSTVSSAGSSGDGFAATAALLDRPIGIAVDANGNLFIADSGNHVVRRIDSLSGNITTVAGSLGVIGSAPPVDATVGANTPVLEGPFGLAVDGDGNLIIADQSTNAVLRLDVDAGTITTLAGGPGIFYTGPSGNRATEGFSQPAGVAVSPAGTIFVTSRLDCVVRVIDLVADTVSDAVGTWATCGFGSGTDGTLATAVLELPERISINENGLMLITEQSNQGAVRLVDFTNNAVVTIAGGGTTLSQTDPSGPATDFDLGHATDVSWLDAQHAFIATENRVWRLELTNPQWPTTGSLDAYGGNGTLGNGGDGGAALAASFTNIQGLACRDDGQVYISDFAQNRIRAIESPNSTDVVVQLGTSQLFLDSLAGIVGDLIMLEVDGRQYLIIPNATSVGGDVNVSGNIGLEIIDLTSLAAVGGSVLIDGNTELDAADLIDLISVGGDFTFTNNPTLTSIDAPELATIGGDMTLTSDPSLTDLSLPSVTFIGGDMTLTDDTSLTTISMPLLDTVGGDMDISNDPAVTTISFPSLVDLLGSMRFFNNVSLQVVSLASLQSIGGDMTITDDPSVTIISAPQLATVGGDMTLSSDPSLTTISMPLLSSVGGDMTLTGDTTLTTISLPQLSTVTGDMTIIDNATTTTIDVPSLTSVGGSLEMEMSNPTFTTTVIVQGDVSITGDGTTSLGATTSVGGSTTTTLTDAFASMTMALPFGTFASAVPYQITKVSDAPELGLDADGADAMIDPVVAYHFSFFTAGTLQLPATLTFDVSLSALSPTEAGALVAAVAAGDASLVVKRDGSGDLYEALPVCAGPQTPAADGCASVTYIDADTIRFSGVTATFSTWGPAIVTTLEDPPPPPPVEACPLIAQWPFDAAGDGALLDTVADHPAVLYGNAAITASGHTGGGLALNGDGFAFIDDLVGALPAFTATVWLNADDDRKMYVVSREGSGDVEHRPWIQIEKGMGKGVSSHLGGGAPLRSGVNPGSTWTHVALVYDSVYDAARDADCEGVRASAAGIIKLYVDGELKACRAGDEEGSTGAFVLGAFHRTGSDAPAGEDGNGNVNDGPRAGRFTGTLDDFTLFAVALGHDAVLVASGHPDDADMTAVDAQLGDCEP